MPVCSTELLLKPSIPTHTATYVVELEQTTLGTIHDPSASVTDPLGPVTAYPPQLSDESAEPCTCISGLDPTAKAEPGEGDALGVPRPKVEAREREIREKTKIAATDDQDLPNWDLP